MNLQTLDQFEKQTLPVIIKNDRLKLVGSLTISREDSRWVLRDFRGDIWAIFSINPLVEFFNGTLTIFVPFEC